MRTGVLLRRMNTISFLVFFFLITTDDESMGGKTELDRYTMALMFWI